MRGYLVGGGGGGDGCRKVSGYSARLFLVSVSLAGPYPAVARSVGTPLEDDL